MAAGIADGMQTFVTRRHCDGNVLFGIVVTLTVSWGLSKTALRGVPPPLHTGTPPLPQAEIFGTPSCAAPGPTLYVLKRAVIVAAPAGVSPGFWPTLRREMSALWNRSSHFSILLRGMGLDGFILMAFILGLPANEIVLPILLMGYLSTGAMTEVEDMAAPETDLSGSRLDWLTALNMMLFSLLHYPCGTTLINIYKETKSPKWTFLSFAIPRGSPSGSPLS